MHRAICLALGLCCACATHEDLRGLDQTTTTSATYRPTVTLRPLEPPPPEAAAIANRPTEIPATAPMTDRRIVELVQAQSAAVMAPADLALRDSESGRVKDFAQLVHDRMHAAELALDLVLPTPREPTSTTWLTSIAGQTMISFDRAYIEVEAKALENLMSTLDEVTAEARQSALTRRLLDLRPQLDDLYTRAFELRQILAH